MLFSECSGNCCVCACGSVCLAGHGDDDYFTAQKEQVVERLNKNKYPLYRDEMIKYLIDKFGYEYIDEVN
jgi:UDP-glucose 6-dehydrogenase